MAGLNTHRVTGRGHAGQGHLHPHRRARRRTAGRPRCDWYVRTAREHAILAPSAGILTEWLRHDGDIVAAGLPVVRFTTDRNSDPITHRAPRHSWPRPLPSRQRRHQRDLVARGLDTNDEWIRSPASASPSGVGPTPTRPSSTWANRRRAMPSPRAASRRTTSTSWSWRPARCPRPFPAAAPQLADRLGIHSPGAFDVSSGCSGFVYSLNVASSAS